MRDVPTILHYSSGFPMVIGLHHVEDYKEIKLADLTERMIFKRKDGLEIQGAASRISASCQPLHGAQSCFAPA